MPKKTRRQKVLAEVHRNITASAPAYVFSPAAIQKQAIIAPTDATEYKAIKWDLVKTIILAGMAITIELLLFIKIGRG